LLVLRGVRHIQGAAVQTRQTPLAIPGAARPLLRNRATTASYSFFSGSAPSRLRA
jgi:hypothetical protein